MSKFKKRLPLLRGVIATGIKARFVKVKLSAWRGKRALTVSEEQQLRHAKSCILTSTISRRRLMSSKKQTANVKTRRPRPRVAVANQNGKQNGAPLNDADAAEDIFISGAGAVLRAHREKKGFTLEALAASVGVNKSTLHRYETDETPISGQMVKSIAKGLRIKAAFLMRDCLFHIRPKLRGSAFGEILNEMLGAGEL